MHDINPTELTTVVGGTNKNDQITQQVTALESSLKDATSNKSNCGNGGNNQFMMLAMMLAMRPQQPTVVAAGGGSVAAPGSVINISTRVRRW